MLKRDNWTNAEVLELIANCKGGLIDGHGEPLGGTHQQGWDDAIEHLYEMFDDFSRADDDYAAMSYDTEKKEVVHTGPILPSLPAGNRNRE